MSRRKLVGFLSLRPGLVQRHRDLGAPLIEQGPAHGQVKILKRAILQHLGIKAAVARTIDVFKKDAVEQRRYPYARLVDVNGDAGRISPGNGLPSEGGNDDETQKERLLT